jgi:hypothetical protein
VARSGSRLSFQASACDVSGAPTFSVGTRTRRTAAVAAAAFHHALCAHVLPPRAAAMVAWPRAAKGCRSDVRCPLRLCVTLRCTPRALQPWHSVLHARLCACVRLCAGWRAAFPLLLWLHCPPLHTRFHPRFCVPTFPSALYGTLSLSPTPCCTMRIEWNRAGRQHATALGRKIRPRARRQAAIGAWSGHWHQKQSAPHHTAAHAPPHNATRII